ncbi:MAG: (2Fe-2S) ferredoxin domain-containing protein [Thermosynechococcaceae cyanobacterium MS004]|nr:(2Fe-2S) ferredoxin domain-containing protein [Thermosynechococcaceae cyanobacterium MS004]
MGTSQTSSVQLVGQLEGYELGKSGKVRALRLETTHGLQVIKLTQSSRLDLLKFTLSTQVSQGSWVEVVGQQKLDSGGRVKRFKAEGLRVLPQVLPPYGASITHRVQSSAEQSATPAKILICQKSSCRKRGSLALEQALEQALDDRQLSGQVCVKATGCLKHCSKGPNLVIGKTSYRNVTVKDLAKLLDLHFAACPAVMI